MWSMLHKRKKYARYNCPKLVYNDKKVKGVEYGFRLDEAHGSLYTNNNETNGCIKCLPIEDNRQILSSLPTKVKGLQIHNMFLPMMTSRLIIFQTFHYNVL